MKEKNFCYNEVIFFLLQSDLKQFCTWTTLKAPLHSSFHNSANTMIEERVESVDDIPEGWIASLEAKYCLHVKVFTGDC